VIVHWHKSAASLEECQVTLDRSTQKMRARAGPILERLLPLESPVMVEVGVFTGFLSLYLLEHHDTLIMHGVDSWVGSEDHSEAYRATGDVHANATASQARAWQQQALQRLAMLIDYGRMALHQCHSLEAAGRFDADSMDLVYLDGDHSYPGVAADIRAWWPKVKPAGWIGGDDLSHEDPRFKFGVDQAVEEFVAATGLELEIHNGYMNKSWFIRKP
jgi:Methyltransferase domain